MNPESRAWDALTTRSTALYLTKGVGNGSFDPAVIIIHSLFSNRRCVDNIRSRPSFFPNSSPVYFNKSVGSWLVLDRQLYSHCSTLSPGSKIQTRLDSRLYRLEFYESPMLLHCLDMKIVSMRNPYTIQRYMTPGYIPPNNMGQMG